MRSGPAKDRGLRVATWNIASNKNFDAVMAKIAGLEIDLCALQEVSIDPGGDLPAVFDGARAVFRDYCCYFSPALGPDGLGGGRADYYGLAIVSKYPLRRALSFPLGPAQPGRAGHAEFEPRILQVAMPQMARPLIFANTHLAATMDLSASATRRAQVARIADILKPLTGAAPVILCGDFNAVPSSDDLADLRAVLPHLHAVAEPTYVGEGAHATIDFFRSSVPLDLDLSVVPAAGLSDHNMVVATLRS